MDLCSIIIPVHNKASLTRQCLECLLARRIESTPFEVIVVDDASTDGTQQVLAAYGDRVRAVTHARNTGFARACNEGAALASGKHLLFLNNDTIPKAGWVDALVSYADRHPSAAVVGAKLLFPNETVQHAGVTICQDRDPRHIYAGFPADHPAVNKSRRFQVVTGACFFISREIFEHAGGFDTDFRNGYEDVDLCLRLGERGHEIHYCHESVLYHLESASKNGRPEEADEDRACYDLYRRRWAHRVRPDDLEYYIEDGLLDCKFPRYSYPFSLTVSPLLAVVDGDDRQHHADRLLGRRSRAMYELLRDNIRLNLCVHEAELHRELGSCKRDSRESLRRSAACASEPLLLFQGEIRWLGNEASGRLISIILPIKNGGDKVRELLPRICSQKSRDPIEIVAVDSGSEDDTVEVLRGFGATVLAIDPRSFNHGLTRNLATQYARGSVFVFLNQSTIPANDAWLANLVAPLDQDPLIAGVCSRVIPRDDADVLTVRDTLRNLNASAERVVRVISDREAYQRLSPDQLREFVNFHTVSASIRADVFRQHPFPEINFAEDLLWGKAALEAGHRLQYEPTSLAFHSHNYSFLDIVRRNFDDALACREIVGRKFDESEILDMIVWGVREDWRYLEQQKWSDASEMEFWRLASVLRRTAEALGQWIGANADPVTDDLRALLSITERIKRGARTEATAEWNVLRARPSS